MPSPPYSQFPREKLILRDHLAVDRTILANERTFLSYIRTSLAIIVTGVSLIRFFDSILLEITGWAIIPCGMIVLGIGIKRYIQTNNAIHRMTV